MNDYVYNLDPLADEVNHLMDLNQALKAWELVKEVDRPIRDRVWQKVKHAFDPEAYTRFYSEGLVELPIPEDLYYDVDKLYPRFTWLVPKIEKLNPQSLLDIGCSDGGLCLTMALRIKHLLCVGLNLYQPSLDIASRKAEDLGLLCQFECQDFRNYNPPHKFDVVVFFELLEHLPDPGRAIKKAYELTGSGGRLYLSTPRTDHLGVTEHLKEFDRKNWDDGLPSGHLRLWTEEEFKEMLKDYRIEEFFVDEHKDMLVEISKS